MYLEKKKDQIQYVMKRVFVLLFSLTIYYQYCIARACIEFGLREPFFTHHGAGSTYELNLRVYNLLSRVSKSLYALIIRFFKKIVIINVFFNNVCFSFLFLSKALLSFYGTEFS